MTAGGRRGRSKTRRRSKRLSASSRARIGRTGPIAMCGQRWSKTTRRLQVSWASRKTSNCLWRNVSSKTRCLLCSFPSPCYPSLCAAAVCHETTLAVVFALSGCFISGNPTTSSLPLCFTRSRLSPGKASRRHNASCASMPHVPQCLMFSVQRLRCFVQRFRCRGRGHKC